MSKDFVLDLLQACASPVAWVRSPLWRTPVQIPSSEHFCMKLRRCPFNVVIAFSADLTIQIYGMTLISDTYKLQSFSNPISYSTRRNIFEPIGLRTYKWLYFSKLNSNIWWQTSLKNWAIFTRLLQKKSTIFSYLYLLYSRWARSSAASESSPRDRRGEDAAGHGLAGWPGYGGEAHQQGKEESQGTA